MEHYKVRLGKNDIFGNDIISYFDDFIDNHKEYSKLRDEQYHEYTEYNLKRHLICAFTLKHFEQMKYYKNWGFDSATDIYSILDNSCMRPNEFAKVDNEIINFRINKYTVSAFKYKSLKLLDKVQSKFDIEIIKKYSHCDISKFSSNSDIVFFLKKEDLKSFLKLYDKTNFFKIIDFKVENVSFDDELLRLGKYTLPWDDLYKNDTYKKFFNNIEYLNKNKKNIFFETLLKNCHQFDLEVLLSLKGLITTRKRYKKLISEYPNLTEDLIIENLDLWNKEFLSKNKVVAISEKIIKDYFYILDFKNLSSNEHLNYQNLIDLAHIYKPNVIYDRLNYLLKISRMTGIRTRENAEEIRIQILMDFNWNGVIKNRIKFKWDTENIIPLIEIFDKVEGLWDIIVAKIDWNSENIIPFIKKFDDLEGIWDIIGKNTTDISFLKEILFKISFKKLICSNPEIVLDSYLLAKLLDLDLPLYLNDRKSDDYLPKILDTIQISNEALLKYKNFWLNNYEFSTHTYKRGESFTYYRGTFPLYKRLFNNPRLDKDYIIKNILPEDVDLIQLKSSDRNLSDESDY